MKQRTLLQQCMRFLRRHMRARKGHRLSDFERQVLLRHAPRRVQRNVALHVRRILIHAPRHRHLPPQRPKRLGRIVLVSIPLPVHHHGVPSFLFGFQIGPKRPSPRRRHRTLDTLRHRVRRLRRQLVLRILLTKTHQVFLELIHAGFYHTFEYHCGLLL
jgi:hypothetical protein